MRSNLEFAAWRPNARVGPTADDPSLRLIGYWKASLRDEYPFPQELLAEYAPGLGDRIASYLEAGRDFTSYLGYSWCRFGCTDCNGTKELTDGVWVWPEGLAHYVRLHPIALPPDFVRHAISTNSPASAVRWPPALVQRAEDSYWIGWARLYRANPVHTMLQESRIAAAEACEAMLDAAGASCTNKFRVGTATCITKGCTRQVLAETAFCGHCLTRRDRKRWQEEAESRELERVIRALPTVLADQPLHWLDA